MVTRVAIQGKEWDLVEGYYLWYSQDGKQWKAYSESGDKLEANVRVCSSNFSLSCPTQICSSACCRVVDEFVLGLEHFTCNEEDQSGKTKSRNLIENNFLYDAQQ